MSTRLDRVQRRASLRARRRYETRVAAERATRWTVEYPGLRQLHAEAADLVERLIAAMDPDPILSQLHRAQEVEDARPNPDDPDDDGGSDD